MNLADGIAIAIVLVAALGGMRRGLVLSAFSLVGLAGGAYAGSRVAPHLLHGGSTSTWTPVAGLVGAVLGAMLLQSVAALVGGVIRTGLRFAPPLRLFDSLGGLAAGAATGLALAWVIGAVAVQVPGHPGWVREAHDSKVLHRLNTIAPPKDVLKIRASLLESF